LEAGRHVPFEYVPPLALHIEFMPTRVVPVFEQAAAVTAISPTRVTLHNAVREFIRPSLW
jgi:hypothetical protein